MLYMSCLRVLRGMRKLHRWVCFILFVFALTFIFMALFCSTMLKMLIIPQICRDYRQNETSGAFCEEFCGETSTFTNFDCMSALDDTFSAEKNGIVYEFQFAENPNNGLSWKDKNGNNVYPKSEGLNHMIKMHLLLNYNVTLEEKALKRLINHEMDDKHPTQIVHFWRLFNNNNYLMTKLFEDEAIFPTILGNCGYMFVVEQLDKSGSHKDLNFKTLYEYVSRLDMIKPDPVKICRIDLEYFGISKDSRVKVVNADYVKLESQLHKQLASGKACQSDDDCHWHDCHGVCEKGVCRGAPKHDNVELLCHFVQMNSGQFDYFRAEPEMQQLYETKCKRKFVRSFW